VSESHRSAYLLRRITVTHKDGSVSSDVIGLYFRRDAAEETRDSFEAGDNADELLNEYVIKEYQFSDIADDSSFPTSCDECGDDVDGTWLRTELESGDIAILCPECAGVDSVQFA
jgi:hypothetical protein